VKVNMLFCLLISFWSLISCKASSDQHNKYLYRDTIDRETYKKFEAILVDSIKVFIKEKKGPFHPKKFDSTTEIFIDTILFSPNQKRMAFFVVTKNSNDKLLSKGLKDEFHFDANCFLAQKDANFLDIQWLSAFNFTRYWEYDKASKRIRKAYFTMLSSIKDNDDTSLYKYNLNDLRFWNGPIWNKYF
jgi:hypothetical protein